MTNVEIDVRETPDYALAQEWELVLLSQGLCPRLRQDPGGYVLSVPEHDAQKAGAALAAYDSENISGLEREATPTITLDSLAASAFAGMSVLGFHAVTTEWLPGLPWFERGSADALRMLHGEVWRAVTALTLHSDLVHALSNAAGTALFLSAVSSVIGSGVGLALVLISGAAGNLANATFHGDPHVSVGASTAVFGAVGILAGFAVVRRWQTASNRRRSWLPIAAALALLAMLGSGGQRVDIWAHLFGLLTGIVTSIVAACVAPRAPGVAIQWLCGGASIAALVFCWTVALR